MTDEELQALTIQDIEEINSRYYAEQEHIELMQAFEKVLDNLSYYPADLLDALTTKGIAILTKDV